MNLGWIRPVLLRSRQWAVRNAPHLLMGLGTSGSLAAVIFAAKATPGAVEAYHRRLNDLINDNEEETVRMIREQDRLPKLTVGETIKACGKYYIAPAGMELFALLCFWGAHGIDVRRQAVLAGLCSTAEQALIEYQKKVVEMIGEQPEKEIRNAIAQDKVDRNPPPSMIFTDSDCWCFYKGYRFRGSYAKLKDIQNEANAEMIRNLYLSECDLLWMFDPDHRYIVPDKDSRMVGWCVDRLIEFDILPAMDPEHRPALVVEIRDKDGREYRPEPGYSAAL